MTDKRAVLFVCVLALGTIAEPAAEVVVNQTPLEINLRSGEIAIDGDLHDAGWQDVRRVETWFETRPGDNIPPKVANLGYLTYDESSLYVALEFADPHPDQIRAPLGDRDAMPSYTDYGGVIIDARNDGKTAQMFLANPSGIKYDAISSDATGEDSSPDYFWESAGRITADGWVLEMRIPFSSLRYSQSSPQRWGIMLYRNYPREYRYQMFTSQLPRDVSCFICNVRPLVGLQNLPSSSHWVAAPFSTANQLSEPEGELGTPLRQGEVTGELGLDAKWLPNPDTVVDATLNPDFSQIEADVPQIAANERFALFYPEKRPFFLEGVDLFSSPIRAVHTRTVTAPRWGLRGTGSFGETTYTALVSKDEGGGSVIVPGTTSSSLADQDFASTVGVARIRHDLGKSFVSFMYAGREIDDGGSNHVFGPDFVWRPNEQDQITGQLLLSRSSTPTRPDLSDEWDGRSLQGHALELWWFRGTKTWDYFALYDDIDEEFRADNGFVPQVGLRRGIGELGYTFWRPQGKISRLRTFAMFDYLEDRDGQLIERRLRPGFGFDSVLNSFVRFEMRIQDIRVGEQVVPRNQLYGYLQFSPGRVFSYVQLELTAGQDVDFDNERRADGVTARMQAHFRPTDHLELALQTDWRTLEVETPSSRSERLLTATVARLRSVYTFNARAWVRLIGEWVETTRDPSLYREAVDARTVDLGASLVFAYKLNWQTVLYLGYGDVRELSELGRYAPSSREAFLKISYAFQG